MRARDKGAILQLRLRSATKAEIGISLSPSRRPGPSCVAELAWCPAVPPLPFLGTSASSVSWAGPGCLWRLPGVSSQPCSLPCLARCSSVPSCSFATAACDSGHRARAERCCCNRPAALAALSLSLALLDPPRQTGKLYCPEQNRATLPKHPSNARSVFLLPTHCLFLRSPHELFIEM